MLDGVLRQRLLLVGWDAVDWNTISPLLWAGFLPNLARLIAGSAVGDLATLYPVTSPIVWTSALTGVPADRHGIFGYADAPAEGASENRARLVTPSDRRVPALWDFVARRGGRSHVVNWPCSYPAYPVGGVFVSDAATRGLAADTLENSPPPPNAIHISDALAGELSVEDWSALRMAAGEVDPAVLARFLPGAGPVPRWLAPALAACFTVHNFATAALETGDDWSLAAFRYPGLLPLAVARARGGSDTSSERAALDGLLRLHDLFLGRLLDLAGHGPETAVLLLSAHGFPGRVVGDETDIRSGIVVLSRTSGTSGDKPGNTRLTGASLLDIAPTARALLGFPQNVADDAGWTGRVLGASMQESSSEKADMSSESASQGSVADNAWRKAALPTDTAASALLSLAREGLIAWAQADGSSDAAISVRQTRQWVQARGFASAHRHDNALPLLQTLHRELPARDDITMLLGDELYQAGRIPEAWATVAALLISQPTRTSEVNAEAHLFFAEDALTNGVRRDALEHLGSAHDLTASPALLFRIGYAYYRLRRVDLAGPCFARAADTDPTAPAAWMGKAGAALLTRQYGTAIAHAQRAIGLQHDNALAHLILARALRFENRKAEAQAAYATAMRLGIHDRRATGNFS